MVKKGKFYFTAMLNSNYVLYKGTYRVKGKKIAEFHIDNSEKIQLVLVLFYFKLSKTFFVQLVGTKILNTPLILKYFFK